MIRYLLILVLILIAAPVGAEPKDSVVRIISHGGSGTVIATGQGWSLILSCGHCFEGKSKAIALDIPYPVKGTGGKVGTQLLGVDQHADVSLIRLNYGPLPYVAPVAPAGFRPGACWSIGYDEMRTPATVRPATIVAYEDGYTLTRERPWHGRSGGGLIDQRTGYLVGVVSAYEGKPDHREISPGFRGMYGSHASILAFLRRTKTVTVDESPAVPPIPQGGYAQPFPWTPAQPFAGRPCPT